MGKLEGQVGVRSAERIGRGYFVCLFSFVCLFLRKLKSFLSSGIPLNITNNNIGQEQSSNILLFTPPLVSIPGYTRISSHGLLGSAGRDLI